MRLRTLARKNKEPRPLLGDGQRHGVLQPCVVQTRRVVGRTFTADNGFGF